MTEKAQDALPAVEQEPKGSPIPEVSGGSVEAGSATTGPDVGALEKKLARIEETLTKLPDLIDARVKSTKDKRFQDLDKIKAYLDEAKGDPKLAARNMVLDEMVEKAEAPARVQGSALGGATTEDAESKTAKFLNDLKDESGVELSDEELAHIWGGKRYTNWDDAFKDAKKAAWKKAKGESIGAGAVVTEAGATASSDDVEDLAKELAKLQKGDIHNSDNKKRRAEIRAKLAAQRG